MSNSSLVSYVKYSPNNYGLKTHSIDRITPHCVVGQCSVETLGDWFSKSSTKASCNYGIGKDGRVGLYVDENKGAWCSSNKANDQRSVTIECASDATHPYAFNDVVYNKLIDLCVDICKRNGKTKLIWISDKNTALNYSCKSNEMLLTVHRWFANKACVPINSEVLTRSGWVKLSDIQIGDEIACADLDNLRITFEEVYDKVPERSQDTYTNNDFTATKDHRCIYSIHNNGIYKIDQYKNLLSNGNLIYIPLAGYSNFEGFKISDAELRLLVAVQADGHYIHEIRDKQDQYIGLEFHMKKKRKIERIKELLDECHYKYTEINKSDGSTSIRVWEKDIVDRCEKFLEDKHFTWDWLYLSPHQAKIFLSEILLWDGCENANLYASSVQTNLDIVNAVASINGVGSRISGSNVCFRETPHITFSKEEKGTIRNNKSRDKEKTTVSCVSVKTGLFLIRQYGKTFITGNCPGDWLMSRMSDLASKVNSKLYINSSNTKPKELYRVRKTWSDSATQLGAFYDKNAAIETAKKCSGYKVFDKDGKQVYPTSKAYSGGFPIVPPILSLKSKGLQVERLQKFLNWYGGYKLTVDGDFGNKTYSAVLDFQKKEKITIDGIFGTASLNKAKTIKK